MHSRSPVAGLREALLAGGPAALHALHGIGGVGKTTTAIEYAHRYAEDHDIAWWVNAEDPNLIPDQLPDWPGPWISSRLRRRPRSV
jgi:KaiC/GvpD/RAD55 family RecA-like ATPase